MTLDLKDKDMVSATDSLTQLPNRKKKKKVEDTRGGQLYPESYLALRK